MAITKIHAIKSTLSKALAYIENPEKTNGQALVSGYNTDPQLASVDFEMTAALARQIDYKGSRRSQNLAYHLIQSFSPDDEVTPEQAHELGRKLASEFTDGRYEFVVATHIDKGHIHNHIMINAVSFYDHKRLRTVPYRTASQIRAISDRLCAEADLSVITDPKQVGQSYTEYLKRAGKVSWRQMIRQRLDFVLEQAHSYNEFKALAAELGITVDDSGQQLTYQIAGAQRKARSDSFYGTDKYVLAKIQEQLEQNRAGRDSLQATIRAAAQEATDADSFAVAMAAHGIKVRVQKRTGTARYTFTETEDNVTVSEAALGNAWSYEHILAAIAAKDYRFEAAADAESRTTAERFAAYRRGKAGEPDTLVQLSAKQIERITTKGLIARVQDKDGITRRITIDRSHTVIGAGGTVSIALGNAFSYFYGTGSNDCLSGEDFIRLLELQDGVAPQHVEIPAGFVRHMSLRGLTLSLPGTEIERIFIPAEYVHYDRAHGTCAVDLYPHWHYSYAVAGTAQKGERRKSLTGKDFLAALDTCAELQRHSPVTPDLRSRIRYVERKSKLAETQMLAKTLLQMSEHHLHTAEDFDAQIDAVQKNISETRMQIEGIQEKNKQYSMAARCLQTYRTLLPVWQKYESTSHLAQKQFFTAHQAELDAFRQATAALDRLGVSYNVEAEKVLNLIQNREQQITDLNARLAELRQDRQELLQMQAEVANIQGDDRYEHKEGENEYEK
jgi:hypothetical protein